MPAAVGHCPNLNSLDLHHNGVGGAGGRTICHALQMGCPRLHTLDISMVKVRVPY